MTSFQVGDVRPATLEDVEQLRSLIDSDDGWNKVYSKQNMGVWMKRTDGTAVQILKVYFPCLAY